jgi:uncharacterized metal-binding protein
MEDKMNYALLIVKIIEKYNDDLKESVESATTLEEQLVLKGKAEAVFELSNLIYKEFGLSEGNTIK